MQQARLRVRVSRLKNGHASVSSMRVRAICAPHLHCSVLLSAQKCCCRPSSTTRCVPGILVAYRTSVLRVGSQNSFQLYYTCLTSITSRCAPCRMNRTSVRKGATDTSTVGHCSVCQSKYTQEFRWVRAVLHLGEAAALKPGNCARLISGSCPMCWRRGTARQLPQVYTAARSLNAQRCTGKAGQDVEIFALAIF